MEFNLRHKVLQQSRNGCKFFNLKCFENNVLLLSSTFLRDRFIVKYKESSISKAGNELVISWVKAELFLRKSIKTLFTICSRQ